MKPRIFLCLALMMCPARSLSARPARAADGDIGGAVWHFFRSPVTGEIGPSGPLYQLLDQNGIGIVIHW